MARQARERKRYGIAEWYGRPIERLTAAERLQYAGTRHSGDISCPFCRSTTCNKPGGVCSIGVYVQTNQPTPSVHLDPSGIVTVCPRRLWQNELVFRVAGQVVLGTDKPTILKEVGFLRRTGSDSDDSSRMVGRIDAVLVRTGPNASIVNWCALEMQAVYISGPSIDREFQTISEHPDQLVLPLHSSSG